MLFRSNTEDISDLLVDLGIYKDIQKYATVIASENAKELLEAALKLSEIKFRNDIIASSIDKVSKIVFSLKNFARFDDENVKISSDIHESIETVFTIFYNKLKRGVEVVRDYNIQQVIPILPDQINQVWMNLVQNSIYAMETNGTITVKTYIKGNYAVIDFIDTGKGIPPENLGKIFDPFFTTKPQGEGTGLGLDIVKKIIQNHNGKIEVESELGKGSMFRIYLPMEESN